MGRGHMYLTAVIDWYNRYIVGWALSDTLNTAPVLEAVASSIKRSSFRREYLGSAVITVNAVVALLANKDNDARNIKREAPTGPRGERESPLAKLKTPPFIQLY